MTRKTFHFKQCFNDDGVEYFVSKGWDRGDRSILLVAPDGTAEVIIDSISPFDDIREFRAEHWHSRGRLGNQWLPPHQGLVEWRHCPCCGTPLGEIAYDNIR